MEWKDRKDKETRMCVCVWEMCGEEEDIVTLGFQRKLEEFRTNDNAISQSNLTEIVYSRRVDRYVCVSRNLR